LAIPFTPMLSFAEEVTIIKSGFMTGNEFLALSRSVQSTYAMGLVDGMLLAPLFKAPKANMYWLETCTVGMTNEQVTAILRKELESNPATWHYAVHSAMYRAMLEVCPGSPKNKK
jgi:hypothetical protein